MATTLSNFQARLDTKLWGANNPISRNVTIYPVTEGTADDYGDIFPTIGTGVVVRCIPYNTFSYQKDYLPWGELQKGQTDMVFPYNTTITSGSIVVDSNSTTTSYEVSAIQPFKYGIGSVAIVARLTEQL